MHLVRSLDTLLSWDNLQEQHDLENVKVLEYYITRFGMISLQDVQKNAQQATIRDLFKRQDVRIRMYVCTYDVLIVTSGLLISHFITRVGTRFWDVKFYYLSIGIVPIKPSMLLSVFRGGVPTGSCEARNFGLLLMLVLLFLVVLFSNRGKGAKTPD